MRERTTRPLTTALAALLLATLAGCAAGDFAQRVSDRFDDDARFWGDHAAAGLFGDDPARD